MDTNLKVSGLRLKNFTVFSDLDITFSPGINVIIGENSAGKTHLMKVIYSVLKADEEIALKKALTAEKRQAEFSEMLMEVFKPDALGRLAKREVGGTGAEINLEVKDGAGNIRKYEMGFSARSEANVKLKQSPDSGGTSCLYIPTVEMLTINEGFLANYLNQKSPYDKTFYYMALALDALPSRGARFKEQNDLIRPLEKAANLSVRKEKGKFYLKFGKSGDMEAPLVAEGIKKLGMLIYLIGNGSLSKNSILFWDEPESHLNPKYIRIVVDFIRVIAKQGVQVFVSTHDYLLSQKLSLLAESKNQNKPDMQFISLTPTASGTSTETAPTLATVANNPILDEFALYADEEEQAMNEA